MKKFIFLFLLSVFLTFSVIPAQAQCSMCRRVAETNIENNSNKAGKSLNSGILYLMAVPYLLGAIGAAIWWKNRGKE